MPRTRSLAWAELKIGVLTVFALVMAAVLIFAVGGTGGFFWQRYALKAVFPNVAGLGEGSPVRVAGLSVGSVSQVSFAGTGVEVTFEVSKDVQPLITTDSLASIGSVSLLGESAVDLTTSRSGQPIPPWGYVQTAPAGSTIAQLTEAATAGLEETKLLVQDIRAGKGTVGRLFTDESVYKEIQGFVRAAERVAESISRGEGTMGKLARDPAMYNELQSAVANLNAITGAIRSGEGSLGRVLSDPALAESWSRTSQHLEGVTGKLNRGEGTAGRLMTDDTLYLRVSSTADRLDQITKRLAEGEGTAGQLLQDKRLYDNITRTVGELRGLIADIRKDPKRYLNVKVSIF